MSATAIEREPVQAIPADDALPYELVRYENEAEWHAIRGTGITASNAAAALGWSRRKTRYRLWEELLGIVERDDLSDNLAAQLGHNLEPWLGRWFSKDTGLRLRPMQFYDGDRMYGHVIRSRAHPWLLASLDFITEDRTAIVECKTTGLVNAAAVREEDWGEPRTDQIPIENVCQIGAQLAATGCVRGYEPVLIGGRPPDWYVIERDEVFLALMIERLAEFWFDHVIAGEPPEIADPDDARRRFPRSVKRVADATDELLAARTEYLSLERQMERLAERQKLLKTQTMGFMGDADVLRDTRGQNVATWSSVRKLNKPKARELYPDEFAAALEEPDVDSDAFKKAIGATKYEALLSAGDSRRFAFTKEKI